MWVIGFHSLHIYLLHAHFLPTTCLQTDCLRGCSLRVLLIRLYFVGPWCDLVGKRWFLLLFKKKKFGVWGGANYNFVTARTCSTPQMWGPGEPRYKTGEVYKISKWQVHCCRIPEDTNRSELQAIKRPPARSFQALPIKLKWSSFKGIWSYFASSPAAYSVVHTMPSKETMAFVEVPP
jgi:hypothetical protein